MKKTIIILGIFALIAGCCTSVAAQGKSIVGLWHSPEDRIILEITPTHFGHYGGDSPYEYKIVSKTKMVLFRNGREHVGEYELSKDGNRFMIVDGERKNFLERVVVQEKSGLIGRYITDEADVINITGVTYIDILDESYAVIGNDDIGEEIKMRYIVSEQNLLLTNNGYYSKIGIYNDILVIKDADVNEIGFYLKESENAALLRKKREEAAAEPVEAVRSLEFRGTTYDDCRAVYYDEDEYVFIYINWNDGEINRYTLPEFELCYMLRKDNDAMLGGDFYYDSALQEDEDGKVRIADFTQYYPQWSFAAHSYKSKHFNIHSRDLGDEHYSLKGEMILDNPANDTVRFNYTGKIHNEFPEVTDIYVYSPDDYKNSSGHFTMNDKKINTPFVFYESGNNIAAKIYLLDRVLRFDNKLEYGVSFELNPAHPFEGTFTYNKGIADEDQINYCRPAFFNQSITEYPNEATITIRKTKQYEIYQIDYALKFSDNRIVKGTYTGKIPKR